MIDFRQLVRGLHEGDAELARIFVGIEELLRKRNARNVMVKLLGDEILSWDGEFLWVITPRNKERLLDTLRTTRIEAARKIVVLCEKAGIRRAEAP